MKKNNMMTRFFAVILSSAMFLSGCGTNAASKDANAGSKDANAGTPSTQEKMKVSVGVLQGYTSQGSWMQKQMEEKYNVEITIVPLPGWTDGQAKINLLMADDSQRPDVMWWWGMEKDFTQWVNAGLLVDVSPYMKKYTNIVDYYSDETMFTAASQDGKIYRIPGDVSEPACMTTWIRQDWLDNLGLSVPTTKDEYANVLEQFTTGDPDKDGKNNTYGFSGPGLEMRNFMPFWSPYNVYPDDFVLADDGSVIYGSIDPKVKDGLRDIVDLYKKGVIDPAICTKTNNADEVFINAGHGSFYRWVTWINPGEQARMAFDAKNPGAKLLAIDPIKGADGIGSDLPSDPGAWCYFGITKNAKDPERIYAMFDDMASKEGYKMRMWGVEGTHYKIVDGVMQPLITLDESIAQKVGLQLFQGFANRKDDANLANTKEANELFAHKIETSAPANKKIVYFASERPLWNANIADIQKNRDEIFYGIITGQRPLDDFDKFVEIYKQLNGDAINQEATQMHQQQEKDFAEFQKNWKSQK